MSGASQPRVARSGGAASADGRSLGSRPARWPQLAVPLAIVAGAGAIASLWRLLSWPSAATVDAWAYAAWGQAVARAERPLFDLGATTPKPFAAFLGTLVSPLPPERAFGVLVALAVGALVAGLFAAGYREAGPVAAAGAVVAFALGARFTPAIAAAYVDLVVAALVMASVALRGYWRIGAFVLAGLLRPEAWVLAGIAGFLETSGTLGRRLGAGAISALVAPLLWILGDLALIGDPLGTLHWQSDRHAERTLGNVPWGDVPGEIWTAVTNAGGAVLAVAGLIGLGLHYMRVRRRGPADAMPLVVTVTWLLLLVLETRFGVELNARYLLPAVAVLALGCGLLVAPLIPGRMQVHSPWLPVGVSVAVLVLVIATADLGRPGQTQVRRNEAIAESAATVRSVLSCGRLGTTRRTARRGLIPQLAASTRTSLSRFGVAREPDRFAGVLHMARPASEAGAVLPPWPRYQTPLGPLAVAPDCETFE
jgi:hypothetical protein